MDRKPAQLTGHLWIVLDLYHTAVPSMEIAQHHGIQTLGEGRTKADAL